MPVPESHTGRPRDPSIRPNALAAAREILAEHGYAGLSFDDIARRAGTTGPTLRRRWSSLAELAFEASLEPAVASEHYEGAGAPAIESTGDPRVDLGSAAAAASATFANWDRAGILEGVIAEMITDQDFGRMMLDRAVDPAQSVLRSVLDGCVAAGTLRRDVDLDVILDVLPAMLLYRRLIARRPLGSEDLEQLVELLVEGGRPRRS